MRIVFIYITNPTKTIAKKIAKHLLKKRLIACANIFPINSLYWWGGKICDEKEFVLIAKTAEEKFEEVKEEVEKMHPYSVPCITKILVEPNKKYLNWLIKEVDRKVVH
jgi:periplasmic divalent cation tolerance protein